MTPDYQIPRNALIWLMSAHAAVIAPHFQYLSPWLAIIWLSVALSRVQIYRGAWGYPSTLVKAGLVVACLGTLLSTYQKLFALEPMVALLISAFLLKLLEMQRKRDALLLLYLGYFVAATQFLFSQTLWATLYGIFTLVLLTTALLGLQQTTTHRYWKHSLRLGSVLVLQSLPLMLVLMVLMPKVGALWTVPYQRNSAQTGISDSMSPGDFSQLSRSGALAFRATFDGAIPSPSQLYWRGLVFSNFDGRTWTQGRWQSIQDGPVIWWPGSAKPDWLSGAETNGEPFKYRISLEPTQQPWLFSLALTRSSDNGIGVTRDFRLLNRGPVRKRFNYRVVSYPSYQLEKSGLQAWQRDQETALPVGVNPQSRRQAQRWWFESGSVDGYIERVLQHFHDNFTYTLRPPALGDNSVDQFLWQTQRGFCEHFAGSFVFMMRAAGIPARVVVGYQGGEVNPLENYLMVYQSSAHAWAEVWLKGQGWVRVDPTAAVAPERIERSLDDALDQTERDLLGSRFELFSYRHIAWLNQVRLQLDAYNYQWQNWVLNFDKNSQHSLLTKWLGNLSPMKIALALLLGSGLVLSFVALRLLMSDRTKKQPKEVLLYQRFEKTLALAGLRRERGEGPQAFAERAKKQLPAVSKDIEKITRLFIWVAYGNNAAALYDLQGAVAAFSRKRVFLKKQKESLPL